MSTQIPGVDAQLEALLQRRDTALADVLAADRDRRLAVVFAEEAEFWSSLYRRSRSRVAWRGALAAEAWARHNAAIWRERADASARGLDGTDPGGRLEVATWAASGS